MIRENLFPTLSSCSGAFQVSQRTKDGNEISWLVCGSIRVAVWFSADSGPLIVRRCWIRTIFGLHRNRSLCRELKAAGWFGWRYSQEVEEKKKKKEMNCIQDGNPWADGQVKAAGKGIDFSFLSNKNVLETPFGQRRQFVWRYKMVRERETDQVLN